MLNAAEGRNDLEGHAVEDVIWGNVTQVKRTGRLPRALGCPGLDLDQSIPGLSINRFCASGMEAVNLAANQVKAGAGDGLYRGRGRDDGPRGDGQRRRGHRRGSRRWR